MHGRRRRAARMDFVPGWKEAARQLGRSDVFAPVNGRARGAIVSHGLNEDDLSTWAKQGLERAYQERDRPKCSREDFADGFIAALRWLRSKSSFLPGKLEDV